MKNFEKDPRATKIKAGNRYGMLTIIKEIEPHINNHRQYRKVLCLCDCGNKRDIRLASITSGQTKSCGCLVMEQAVKLVKIKHGLCGHPLYRQWESMISRCYNSKGIHFNRYGGRGVLVCEEWKNDPKLFFDWAIENGWRKGLHIDKDIIPKKLGVPALLYSPEMCSVVSHRENGRNTSATKLSVQMAENIKQLYLVKGLTKKCLAFMYNVRVPTIHSIIIGKTWAV